MALEQAINFGSNMNDLELINSLNLNLNSDNSDKNCSNESNVKPLYLRVVADMNPERAILPQKIIWNDGRQFLVQKITDIRREFVKEVGELCLRYYCLIDGKFRILCLNDDMRWFVTK